MIDNAPVTNDPNDIDNIDNMPKRYDPNKNKAVFSKLVNVLSNIFIVILGLIILAILVFMIQSMRSDGPPVVLGHQIYIVRSNSMSPTFETGSLTIVKKIAPELVQVGDIITYQRRGEGISTTHRVVEMYNDDSLQFITRGDANNVEDPLPVESHEVLGKVVVAIPYIGFVLGFAKTKEGIAAMLVIPGLIIMFSQVKQLVKYAKEKKKITAQ